jgi:hypothetical protein
LEEMQAFFQMMLPGSIPINVHRYIVDVKLFGPVSFDAVKTLEALEYLRAERWNLESAAFLIHGWSCDYAQGDLIEHVFREDHSAEDARRFVRYFYDIPYADMMAIFKPNHFLTLEIYSYRAGLYQSDIPTDYIASLLEDQDHRDVSYLRWNGSYIRTLFDEGVPAEYISGFWTESDVFNILWNIHEVPSAFALGCKEAGIDPSATIRLHHSGIPLEYALPVSGAAR